MYPCVFSVTWITLAHLNTPSMKKLENLSFVISISTFDTSLVFLACSIFFVADKSVLHHDDYLVVLSDGAAASRRIFVPAAPWYDIFGNSCSCFDVGHGLSMFISHESLLAKWEYLDSPCFMFKERSSAT